MEDRTLMSFTPFPMFAGNPVNPGVPQQFSAVGTANVTSTIADFKTAIGGADVTTQAGPQASGFRTINWDGVTLTGNDFGGPPNTTVISSGKTVGIPLNRFQARGVFFDEVYAVSGDGFTSVNPGAANLFPAFSTANTFAMFNDNTIEFDFVTPTATGAAPSPAATRGFGAVFLNVELPNTTSIEYFAGGKSLGKFFAPVGAQAQPEFLGELFNAPVVTSVTITLGTDALFSFDGTNFQAGSGDNPGGNHNIVVTDDFIYAEPKPIANAATVLNGSQGTNSGAATIVTNVGAAFNGTVATFSSANAAATAKDFFAVINWGDGHLTNGTVTANTSGGFDVAGTNTFTTAGLIPVAVTAYDFGGSEVTIANTARVNKVTSSITLASSSNPGLAGQSITYTATVTNPAGAAAPTGTVAFLDGANIIGVAQLDANGVAKFTTTLTPGSHSITAVYNGDNASASSTSTAVTQVINADVTSLLTITLGGRKRKGRNFLQRVLLKNNSTTAIGGPVFLVLNSLSSNVRLANSAGTTTNVPPLGSPFIKVSDGGIGAGSSQTIDLLLSVKRGRVTFTPRVLSGISQP